jgi:predicted ATP-binding protein involved in virulence
MLSQQEESQILRGIDDIMFNLRHVPVDDVAFYLVKFNPKLADELAAALEHQFFDKNEGKNHE